MRSVLSRLPVVQANVRYFARVRSGGKTIKISKAESLIDSIDQSSLPEQKQQSKLQTSLAKKEKVRISDATRGSLEAFGEDFSDIFNECLHSRSFIEIFPGVKPKENASVVRINSVILNQDVSHATAYWTSPVLDSFWNVVEAKVDGPTFRKFRKNSIQHVTDSLQNRESKFRTAIIKRLDLKRVPRVFFKHFDKKTGSVMDEERQQILRTAGPVNRNLHNEDDNVY